MAKLASKIQVVSASQKLQHDLLVVITKCPERLDKAKLEKYYGEIRNINAKLDVLEAKFNAEAGEADKIRKAFEEQQAKRMVSVNAIKAEADNLVFIANHTFGLIANLVAEANK